MQKKDGKWFTRKKGAMLVLTLCLVGAAAATTYYAVDLSDTAQEPAKEHMVDLNESPVETEAEAVIHQKRKQIWLLRQMRWMLIRNHWQAAIGR